MSAAGLSPEALHSLTQMVEHARRLEGLDVRPGGGAALSDSLRAVFRPVRRGRRARVRARRDPCRRNLARARGALCYAAPMSGGRSFFAPGDADAWELLSVPAVRLTPAAA